MGQTLPVTRATVAFWHSDEGWGAIRTPDRPGLGFVHFAQIRNVEGYRDLSEGQEMEFEWGDDLAQDGCQWRPSWVSPIQNDTDS
jgi:cold shock CspA family protein